MQASFGRLDTRTLQLEPGLNIISGGNESGKSTWAEFLAAMLYGVDTRARARGDALPVKAKYAPWSGKPMAGRLELEWQGKHIVLERSSEQTPLGTLRAADRDSGSPIPELSPAHCGEALTGAEESVYRRSAFLRQGGPAVSADPQLEKRLSSLVTAGSEDYSCAEVDRKLKKLQNSLQFNQNGLLPAARAELDAVDEKLRRVSGLLHQQNAHAAELRAKQAEEAELVRLSDGIDALHRRNLHAAAESSRAALQEATAARETWESRCAALPDADRLSQMRNSLRELRDAQQSAAMEDRLDPVRMPELPEDPRFSGLEADALTAEAAQDAQFVREASELPTARRQNRKLFLHLIPGLAVLILSVLLNLLLPKARNISWALLPVSAGLLIWAIARHIQAVRHNAQRRQRAQQILAHYDCNTADGISQVVKDYLQKRGAAREALAEAERTLEARKQHAAELDAQQAALLRQLRDSGAACDSLNAAELWLEKADRARLSLETALRTERQLADQYRRLRQTDRQTAAPAKEDLREFADLDPAVIRDRLSRCREALIPLRAESDRLAGAIGQIGDTLALHAERAQLAARIAHLEQRYAAIQLARTTLRDADESLRSRFAPMLCKRAGELFARLTGGKYDRIALDREMRVTVHPAGSPTDRPLAYVSGGTADQLYLALRLAICDLLLPDAPIVLDDALVYFDDERLRLALDVLRELGKTRQILLFTCQTREKRILDARVAAEA